MSQFFDHKTIKINLPEYNIDIFNSENNNYVLINEVSESNVNINIDDNTHVKIMVLSFGKAKEQLNINADIKRYGSLKLIIGLINDYSLTNVKITLNGEGSEANISSLIYSSNSQFQKANFEIVNNASFSNGNIDVIGIAKNQSQVRVDGIGRINKGMHQSQNYQHLTGVNSEQAIIEMNPYLLIDEHDVLAGHGATIGQIDEEVVYYMMSRGIPQKTAEELYLMGIVSPFIDQIFNKDLCEQFNMHLWGDLSEDK